MHKHGMRVPLDYNLAPVLLIWEITRACALSCRHCRAEAIDRRDPGELTLDEGKRLIDDVASMQTPLIIFTGGDPLQRTDLEDHIRHAKGAGLRVGTIPATTDRLTRERVASLKGAGVDQMALSLDGPTAEQHDDFRRVPGSFAKAMEGAAWAVELGVPLQINTVFGDWNADRFDEMADLVVRLGTVFWEIFFLVPTGRGAVMQPCTPEQSDKLFAQIYEFSEQHAMIVKVTEAPHYRRYVAERMGIPPDRPDLLSARRREGGRPAVGLSANPVNAGRGFCFVDHTGNVMPSGFLPIPCGNVREKSVVEIYRNAPLFRELRDTSLLKGICAACPYRDLCSGGSRARAYAMTGDYLASEPCCSWKPN